MKKKPVSSGSGSIAKATSKLGKAGDSLKGGKGNKAYCPKISYIG